MRLVLRFIVLGILFLLFLLFIGIKYLASEKSVQEAEDDAALHLLESFPDDAQASEGIQGKSEPPPLSINIAIILIISLLTVALLITGIIVVAITIDPTSSEDEDQLITDNITNSDMEDNYEEYYFDSSGKWRALNGLPEEDDVFPNFDAGIINGVPIMPQYRRKHDNCYINFEYKECWYFDNDSEYGRDDNHGNRNYNETRIQYSKDNEWRGIDDGKNEDHGDCKYNYRTYKYCNCYGYDYHKNNNIRRDGIYNDDHEQGYDYNGNYNNFDNDYTDSSSTDPSSSIDPSSNATPLPSSTITTTVIPTTSPTTTETEITSSSKPVSSTNTQSSTPQSSAFQSTSTPILETTQPPPEGFCNLPSIPANSEFMTNYPSPVAVGSSVGIDCESNLVWPNQQKRMICNCTATGTWTLDPMQVDCENGTTFADGMTSKNFTCTQNKTWSPSPESCEALQQGICTLFPIDNSTSSFESTYPQELLSGSSIAVLCNNGYAFPGNWERWVFECFQNGTWGPTPGNTTCQVVPSTTTASNPTTAHESTATTAAVCTLFSIDNSTSYFVNSYPKKVAPGSVIAVNCNSSYSFSDETIQKIYTCLPSGNWSPDPNNDSCSAVPDAGFCNLFQVDNSTNHFEASYPPQVSENSTVAVLCNNNSVFLDGSTRKVYTCENDGSWVPNPMNISCIPSATASSTSTATSTSIPSANATIATTTAPVFCQVFKLNSTTSSFADQYPTQLPLNSNVTVNCSSGYSFPHNATQKTFTCLANSTWSHAPFNCTVGIKTCPLFPLNTTTSSFNSSYPNITHPGDAVTVTCKPGYNFPDNSPTRIFTCTSNGTWIENPSISYCVPEPSCSLFPINTTTSSFQQIYPAEVAAGEGVAVACKNGYMFDDLSSVRIYQCITNGTWVSDPSTDICNATIVSCPIPTINLTNAMGPSLSSSVFATTSDVGTQVFHLCNPSFSFLTGQPINIYQCLGDGTWSANLNQQQSCISNS